MSDIELSTHATENGHVMTAFAVYKRQFGRNPDHYIMVNYSLDVKEHKNILSFYEEEISPLMRKNDFSENYSHAYYSFEDDYTDPKTLGKLKYIFSDSSVMVGMTIYNDYSVIAEFYSQSKADLLTAKNTLTDHFEKFKFEKKDGESYIHLICRNNDGFYTHPFEVSNGLDFESIFDNYEDNFQADFSDVILEKLSDPSYNKGIVLLHGNPGTGKTTYLRYLLSKIKKKVMYLPPEMGHMLSDPSFITFLMENPNSILCIEDAENIIKTREAGSNQAVSNILNITDGLLGSALKYQVICTFNAEFTEIDSALVRKGRMIGEYEFKALSRERTSYLVKKLYGENTHPLSSEMTVAEIHEMKEVMPSAKKEHRRIGF